jgi:hypothetical protein
LASQRSSNIAPNLIPPPSTQLCHTHALADVREYVWLVHALALYTFTTPSIETIVTLHHLHPLAEVDLLPFVDNCHLDIDLVLDRKAFISALTHSPHFSFSGPSNMVYEILWDCFVLSDFEFFFGGMWIDSSCYVLPLISRLLVALWLLVLDKHVEGISTHHD